MLTQERILVDNLSMAELFKVRDALNILDTFSLADTELLAYAVKIIAQKGGEHPC